MPCSCPETAIHIGFIQIFAASDMAHFLGDCRFDTIIAYVPLHFEVVCTGAFVFPGCASLDLVLYPVSHVPRLTLPRRHVACESEDLMLYSTKVMKNVLSGDSLRAVAGNSKSNLVENDL